MSFFGLFRGWAIKIVKLMILSKLDRLIVDFDRALRVVAGVAHASRTSPGAGVVDGTLDQNERSCSAGLMRVNHVGEICAQALYDAQSRFAQSGAVRDQFALAGREEEDHLAWTAQRLQELGSRPSILNPLWYAGAHAMGVVAARIGDAQSLAFVVETERQVEAHLASHLQKLPDQDKKSRAIVEQMRLDEISHGSAAEAMGASTLPVSIRQAMTAFARVMTSTAYYL